MKSASRKYLLFLFILLLSGYSKSYAHLTSTTKVHALSIETSQNANCERMAVCAPKNYLNAFLLDFHKEFLAETIEEEEKVKKKDEVLFLFHKNFVLFWGATPFYQHLNTAHLLSGLENKIAPHNLHVFIPHCKQYIRFQVFRI